MMKLSKMPVVYFTHFYNINVSNMLLSSLCFANVKECVDSYLDNKREMVNISFSSADIYINIRVQTAQRIYCSKSHYTDKSSTLTMWLLELLIYSPTQADCLHCHEKNNHNTPDVS